MAASLVPPVYAAPDDSQQECEAAGGTWNPGSGRAGAGAGCDGATASAAAAWPGENFIADEVYKNASAHQHYYWLYSCWRNHDIDKTTRSEVDSWDFFQGGDDTLSTLGAMYEGGKFMAFEGGNVITGIRDCDDEGIVKTAFAYNGFTGSSRETFCSITGKQYGGGGVNYDTCVRGVGGDPDHWDNDASDEKRAKWFEDNAKKPPFGGAEEYVRAYLSAVNETVGCKIAPTNDTTLYDDVGSVPDTGNDDVYGMPVFVPTEDGSGYLLKYMKGVGLKSSDSEVPYVATTKSDSNSFKTRTTKTCNEIVQLARDNANAYGVWLRDHPDAGGIDTGNDDDPTVDRGTTCNVEGIGWLVCPLIIFMSDLNDKAYGFLADKFLQVDKALYDNGTSTEVAWGSFRTIANALFVIGALIIVYSQMTGTVLSNYNVKKMLPRLLLVAIAVNVSFIICQIAVDISNIVGSNIYQFFQAVPVNDPNAPGVATGSDLSWGQVATQILAGVIAVAVGLVLLISLGGAGLLAMLLIILILVGRQAMIILLIVLSPLAFAAYLLPNTEQWFRKWWQIFYALLLVFPIIGVIFGASLMASQILGGLPGVEMKIIALGVSVIPLFAVPMALKGALAATGTIGAKLEGFSNAANKRAGKRFGQSTAGGILKHRQHRAEETRARIQAGSYRGRGGRLNPRNLRAAANRRLNDSAAFNRATRGYGADRDLDRQSQERGDQKDTIAMFNGDYDLAQAWATNGGAAITAANRGGLSDAQVAQYNRMRAAGHHQKSASHIATAQFLAETGQGSGAQIESALAAAEGAGASATDVASARENAIGTARASGRGDTVAEMRHAQGNAAFTTVAGGVDYAAGWAETDPSKAHRAGLAAGSGGRQGFVDRLNGNRDATRQALAGFDGMEARARNLVEGDVVAAAQAHQYNETGATPTITSVQDAKDYFGVR